MNLIIHIFLKDARHLWREIAVSFALVATYGGNVPYSWAHPGVRGVELSFAGAFFGAQFWARLLVVLVPLAWAFTVIRVIQSESLVGDRQFWVTRPYDWRQLLAAKLLFILVFVNLPMFVLDLFLLSKADFTPLRYLAGLFWMQLLMTIILLLPMAALAAVTATVVQLLLTLLVIVLYLVGSSALEQHLPASSFTSTDPLPTILMIATPFAVIALQYARRRTAWARLLILGLMGALVLISVAAPYRTLIHRQYPPPKIGEQSPFQLGLGQNPGLWQRGSIPDPKEAGIVLPLTISRADPDSILIMKGSRVELDGPNGEHWDAGWISMNSINLLPGENLFSVNFAMPRSLYDRLIDSPIELRVTLAFAYFQDANRRKFVVPNGTFSLPEAGLCSAMPIEPPTQPGFTPMISCLAPMHRPTSLLLTLKLAESTCPLPQGQPALPLDSVGRGWIESSESPAEFGISPVSQFELAPFTFSNVPSYPDGAVRPLTGICPGTPLTLSNPHMVGDTQFTQALAGFHLPDSQKSIPTGLSSGTRPGFGERPPRLSCAPIQCESCSGRPVPILKKGNTIRFWPRGELGPGYRECVRPRHRQVPRGASVDRAGTAPPCVRSGGGYRSAASFPIADAISGSRPAARSACRSGCRVPRRPGSGRRDARTAWVRKGSPVGRLRPQIARAAVYETGPVRAE